MTAFIEAQTQRDLSHAYPTASSIWPHPVASGCIPRKRLRGARAPLSWCFVMWQVVDSNHRRRSRRFYSPLAPPESPPADQRVRRSRRDCGLPPSAMRPWAPGSGGRTAHGRRRNWPRTRAKRPTDAGGKATDGAGGSGHADRSRPDSRPDLPFQDACSLSPSPSSPGSCSASPVPRASVMRWLAASACPSMQWA